jgi:hypothetical protein
MTDATVLSMGDALIRESDLNLLNGPFWLNDRIIGFYFEYLHLKKFESSSGVCFISPEVSQFLKLSNFEEIPIFLEPLELERKDVILLAVNNANDPSGKQMQAAPFPHPPGRLSLVSTFDIGRCFSTFSLWGTLFKRAGLFVIIKCWQNPIITQKKFAEPLWFWYQKQKRC